MNVNSICICNTFFSLIICIFNCICQGIIDTSYRIIIYLCFKFVLCFFIGITNVFANPKCTQPDESWKYKETITKSSSDPGQSMETETEKTVCCELGGNQTKQYYCDVYTKTSEGSSGETPSEEEPSGETPIHERA